MKELRKPHADEDAQNLTALLGYEEVIAGMKPDVFALFQQLLSETGEGDGFLYFCYALTLEQRQEFDKALDAYLTARKKKISAFSDGGLPIRRLVAYELEAPCQRTVRHFGSAPISRRRQREDRSKITFGETFTNR
jgi:hypothetical protein